MTEILRGETPADIEAKCLTVCKKFLSGVWQQISTDQLIVTRISGGFTNLMFRCSLAVDVQALSVEPRDVYVMFYGKKWFKSDEQYERLSDVVVNVLASEHGLCAKVYGIFTEGMVGQYLDCRHLSVEDQQNRRLMAEVGRKLARFHSLKVPGALGQDWYARGVNEFYRKAYETYPNLDELLRELNAKNLLKNDMKREIDFLVHCMKNIPSPVVYSHNDFFAGNILIKNMNNKSTEYSVPDDESVAFCDFEYSCYSSRGFDFGWFATGLGKTSNWFDRRRLPFPSDAQLEPFLGAYIEEASQIHGTQWADCDANRMAFMVTEAKFFSLCDDINVLSFMLSVDEFPDTKDRKIILTRVDEYYGWYIDKRIQFQREGIIPMCAVEEGGQVDSPGVQ